MLEEIDYLIQLQKIDNKIESLNNLLFRMSDEIIGIKKNIEEKRQNYEHIKEDFDKAKSDKLAVERDHAQKRSLLENAQKKLTSVKNSKEYEAVLKELDILKKEINTSEYRILELTDILDTLTSKLEESKKDLEAQENILNEKLSVKDDEDKEKKRELEEAQNVRAEVSSKIKRQLFAKYETIRKARNNLAIVRIENETCTGCYMKVPPQLYVEVKKDRAVHQCPNCQRFLYFLNDETNTK